MCGYGTYKRVTKTNNLEIENYLKLSAVETLLIYFCQFIVIAASTLVSSIMIMRLKPKEILSKMSQEDFGLEAGFQIYLNGVGNTPGKEKK